MSTAQVVQYTFIYIYIVYKYIFTVTNIYKHGHRPIPSPERPSNK